MIEVMGFGKAYDAAVAVHDLSFAVQPGQVMGLVGPNGAGKTTTLRALAGIIPPSRGTLRVAGHDLETAPLEAKRRTAYVPDDPQLFQDLTVEQHLAFTASAYRVPHPHARIAELLATFQLDHKRTTRAAELSRGMRQKLAICCGYLYQPRALLLDEPMTGLDPHGIRVLRESVRQRAREGAAVIISSHLLAMVEDICSHALIMEQGRKRFAGTIEELRGQYGGGDERRSLEEIFLELVSLSPAARAVAEA